MSSLHCALKALITWYVTYQCEKTGDNRKQTLWSQGSVATHLRCSGIFNDQFTTNLLVSLLEKRFLKSVKAWQSYRQEVDCLIRFVRPSRPTVQLKVFARHLEYGQKQLLLGAVMLIFDSLPRQLSQWCGPTLTCRLTPSATNWMLTIVCKGSLLRPPRDWRRLPGRPRITWLIGIAKYTVGKHRYPLSLEEGERWCSLATYHRHGNTPSGARHWSILLR